MLFSAIAFAQPANDNCSTAQSLGTLPSPAACPNGLGAAVTLSGTTINATAPAPYTYLLGCGTGGNQPAPALDVWYSFVASGTRVTIVINPGSPALAAPAITLWQGTNCNNLVGVGCDNNGTNAGANTVIFEPLTIGQTYFIQVSGMTATASGNFNMAVNASNDCADCNLASSLTVTPQPVNGTYLPGTQVTFCYTVTNWVQISSNWIHGIIPTFGNGWNIATLQSNGTPPPASQGYSWFWGTGPLGVGWWVDYDPVGPGSYDGNFANNFGYLPTNGTGSWTWCWRITTNSNCASGTNLNMSINTTADGETGNWTSPACLDDPIYNFSAILNCCLPPTLTTTNVLCNGASTGSITATPTSGASPWDFVWTNASGTIVGSTMNVASNTVSNLPAGLYTVTVTDNAGCVSTAQTTITQPLPVSAIATSTPICNGATNGAINLSVTGGTPAYNISWTGPTSGNPAGNEIISAGGTYTISSLAAGLYTITVADANNCQITTSNTITSAPPLNVVNTTSPTQCASATGTIVSTVTGGTATYNVSWTGTQAGNPIGNEISVSGGSYTMTNLAAGNYTVTTTDAIGCVNTYTATINQPTATTFNATNTPANCYNTATGSITITPTAGVAGFNVSWSGVSSDNPAGTEISSIGGSYTIPSLAAGDYNLTVTASNNCTATTTVTVNQPTLLTASSSATPILCNGGTSTVTVTAAGGTGNYTGTGTFTVTAGTYTYTVTDANGCTATTTITVTQPTAGVIAANSATICNGATNGAINLSVTGGTPAYNISWTGPTTGNPAGNEIISAGGTYTIPSLAAGSYSITATDANNCTSSASNSVIEATIIAATESSTAAQCGSANGTITIIASGGTEPYSVSWSGTSTGNPAGNEIATSGSSYTINGLADGTYTITITDAMGCVHPINSTVAQTSAVAFTVSPSQATCNGATTGSIVVTPSGGTPNYEISWSGPVSGNPMGSEITTAGGNYTIPFLSAGNYTITLTDGNNCSSSMPAVVTEPAALNVTSTPTAALCSGDSNGSIAIGVNGGTAAYNISWNGNISGDPVGNEINASGGNYTLSNLSSGNYSITTTDANLCSTTLNVTVGPGVSITALLPAINSQCLTGNSFNFSGANATISAGSITSYTWDFGDATPAESGINTTHSYSTAGTFVVTLTVSNGNCSSTTTTSIDVIANPAATASNNSPICAGAILNLNANTIAGATYSWSGPLLYSSLLEDPTLTPATTNMSGVYTLTVTLNGCSSTATTTATISAITDPTINPIASLCINSSPVQLTAASPGGTWSGIGITDTNLGTFNPSIAGAGPAIITYNSAGNCGSSDTQNIVVNPLPIPSFSANNTTGCVPLSTTITNTSVPPGNGCTWWVNGTPAGNNCSSLSYTFNSAGCFDIGLSATDANGCQGTTTLPSFICTSLPPVASFSFTPNNPSVNNTLIQFIDLSLGATSETWTIMDLYTFPVAPVFEFPNESAGEYNVCLLVSNNEGCTDLECATVAISDEIIVFVPNCFTPNSDNRNELFRPSIRGNSLINTYEFRIFNRWGEVVFFTRDPEEGWIGNTHHGEYFVPDGVYIWQLKIAPKDGQEPFERTGHVTIYR